MMRVVIIGATSAIAQAYARQISIKRGITFVLVGRNESQLQITAQDLLVRNPNSQISVESGDLESPQFVNQVTQKFSTSQIDVVLIAQGALPEQASVEKTPSLLKESISVNATSPAMFADAFASRMIGQEKNSVIAIIGSVAGDRGRKSNYSYGASKAFIDTFSRGLQHRVYGTGVNVLLIKPGPVKTPMTAHMANSLNGMAKPESVARDIERAIDKRKLTLYTPGKWAIIMWIIRRIPASIFNKLNL
jgi:decaprenylphospho-beta-D-erythro-pentofuranosid-2-ulose 2-reductase